MTTTTIDTPIQTMKLSSLILDPAAQPRVHLDERIIEEYAEAMREGAEFPPVIAYGTQRKAWLGDGWHRYHATQACGLPAIAVDLRPGSLDDAVWYSVTTNAVHGLRRTNADKNRAVTTALTIKPTLADNEIARHCGVHHSLVSTVRRRLEGSGEIDPATVRETTRGGSPIQQRVSGPSRRQNGATGAAATAEASAPGGPPASPDEPPIDEATAVAVIKRYRRLRLFPVERAALLLPEGEDGMTAEEVGEIADWFGDVSQNMAEQEHE